MAESENNAEALAPAAAPPPFPVHVTTWDEWADYTLECERTGKPLPGVVRLTTLPKVLCKTCPTRYCLPVVANYGICFQVRPGPILMLLWLLWEQWPRVVFELPKYQIPQFMLVKK